MRARHHNCSSQLFPVSALSLLSGVNTTLYNPSKRDALWRRDVFGAEDDEVVILWVARIVREKGIDVFIRAMRQLFRRAAQVQGTPQAMPPLRLVIAGSGPDLGWLQSALSVRECISNPSSDSSTLESAESTTTY